MIAPQVLVMVRFGLSAGLILLLGLRPALTGQPVSEKRLRKVAVSDANTLGSVPGIRRVRFQA